MMILIKLTEEIRCIQLSIIMIAAFRRILINKNVFLHYFPIIETTTIFPNMDMSRIIHKAANQRCMKWKVLRPAKTFPKQS